MVIPPNPSETVLVNQLDHIVGDQLLDRKMGGVNDQAVPVVDRKGNLPESPIGHRGVTNTAQSHVRNRLGHAIGSVGTNGQVGQPLFGHWRKRCPADNKGSHPGQPPALRIVAQRLDNLCRYHRGKIDPLVDRSQRTARRRHDQQIGSRQKGPHNHHLAGYVVGREAQQHRRSGRKSEIVDREPGRLLHVVFQQLYRLGSPG